MYAIRLLAVFCAAMFFATVSMPALAQSTTTVQGTVIDASTRGAVAGADVLIRGNGIDQHTTTDAKGTFTFSGLSAGSYTLSVTARGYTGGNGNPITLAAGETATISVAIQPVSATSLKTIASVSVAGKQSVNTGSAPLVTITKQEFIKNGNLLISQGLETTPGVTIQHYDASLGSVSTLTIRGAGGFVGSNNTGYEVLVLQDGEPMRNGQYGDFDLSTLTPSIYKSVDVLKGIGGTSLFGANSIGGTLNLETIDPLATAGAEFIGQVGSFGTTAYDLAATDTFGRFGFVFDVHRMTTEGNIPYNFLGDYTPSAFCTNPCIWNPSQTFNLQSGLLKLKYQLSPATFVTVSAQDEADLRGQLGILTNPTTEHGNAYNSAGIPFFYGFPGDDLLNSQPKFSVDLHTQLAGGDLVLRSYAGTLNRVDDGNNEPPGTCCYYQVSVDRLYGDQILWNKATDRNELTLGYGGNGDNYYAGNTPTSLAGTGPLGPQNIPYVSGTQVELTYLARDRYQVTPHLEADGTLYYSSYDTLNVKRFDPRLGLVYRPDSTTAVRFSYATGFAPPRLSDLYSPLNLSANSSTSDPRCPASETYCVASIGNPNLKSESGNGYNLGFDKSFLGNNGIFSFDIYRTNLSGHIYTANLPAPAGKYTFSDGTPVLFIAQPFNLAGAVYTGFEATTRIPIYGGLAATGYYTTQAAYPFGLDVNTENAAANLVNNQQFAQVPLHQASYGLDFVTRNRFEVFANSVYFGTNNSYAVPPFWVVNLGAVVPLQNGSQFNISWNNIGNKNATMYSLFDGGVAYPGLSGPYPQTALPYQPTTFLVSYTYKWGSFGTGTHL